MKKKPIAEIVRRASLRGLGRLAGAFPAAAIAATVAVAMLFAAAPPFARAHHSAAMFNDEVVLTLQGTVTRFDYLNPHAWLYVDVESEDGTVTEWGFELDAPPRLRRVGVSPTFWQPGDAVTVRTNPLHDGRPAGHLVGAVSEKGNRFGNTRGIDSGADE